MSFFAEDESVYQPLTQCETVASGASIESLGSAASTLGSEEDRNSSERQSNQSLIDAPSPPTIGSEELSPREPQHSSFSAAFSAVFSSVFTSSSPAPETSSSPPSVPAGQPIVQPTSRQKSDSDEPSPPSPSPSPQPPERTSSSIFSLFRKKFSASSTDVNISSSLPPSSTPTLAASSSPLLSSSSPLESSPPDFSSELSQSVSVPRSASPNPASRSRPPSALLISPPTDRAPSPPTSRGPLLHSMSSSSSLSISISSPGTSPSNSPPGRSATPTSSPSSSTSSLPSPSSSSSSSSSTLDLSTQQMIYCALLGIRLSLSGNSQARGHIPEYFIADDFRSSNKIEVKRNQTNTKRPVSDYSFTFTEHCPLVFRAIRHHCHLDDVDFLLSLAKESSLSSMESLGKSGAAFFYSPDKKYVFKSVTTFEMKRFREFLSDYYHFLIQNPKSILGRIVSLFSLSFSILTMSAHYIVMMNVFYTPIYPTLDETYDLKGSRIGRTAGSDSAAVNPSVLKKDLDFAGRILFGPGHLEEVQRIIETDCGFLQRTGRVDYSLLLGIHSTDKALSTSDGDGQFEPRISTHCFVSSGLDGQPFKEIYFLGIIDFLQNYNLAKRVESRYKSSIYDHDPEGISVVEPNLYARRFVDFIKSKLGWFAPEPEQPTSSQQQLQSSSSSSSTSLLSPEQQAQPSLQRQRSGGGFRESIASMISSAPAPPLPLEPVVFTGLLEKQGDLRRSWKSRWFSLTETRLSYFETDKEPEPLGVIVLSENVRVNIASPARSKTRPFCFEIVCESRTYLLSAETDDLRSAWLSVIQQALTAKFGQATETPTR